MEFVYEFLYRGSVNEEQQAWHVILMDGNGKQRVLNMTQAEEEGWSLPLIISDINTATMREVEQLRTVVASQSNMES